jgi:hypothetical protein
MPLLHSSAQGFPCHRREGGDPSFRRTALRRWIPARKGEPKVSTTDPQAREMLRGNDSAGDSTKLQLALAFMRALQKKAPKALESLNSELKSAAALS